MKDQFRRMAALRRIGFANKLYCAYLSRATIIMLAASLQPALGYAQNAGESPLWRLMPTGDGLLTLGMFVAILVFLWRIDNAIHRSISDLTKTLHEGLDKLRDNLDKLRDKLTDLAERIARVEVKVSPESTTSAPQEYRQAYSVQQPSSEFQNPGEFHNPKERKRKGENPPP